jgi:hypothetical protein
LIFVKALSVAAVRKNHQRGFSGVRNPVKAAMTTHQGRPVAG